MEYIDNSLDIYGFTLITALWLPVFTCQGLAAMQGETVARWMLLTSSLKSRDGILAKQTFSGNKCHTGNGPMVFFHFFCGLRHPRLLRVRSREGKRRKTTRMETKDTG